MKQGQQAAEDGGADGGCCAPGVPHQVGEQDVAQELLGLVGETPAGRQSGQRRERCGKNLYFYAKIILEAQWP